MSCGDAGRKKSVYTGNQVGAFNYVGFFNYVAGGPPGSGLSAGTTVTLFIPKSTNRAVWKRKDAVFDDKLLDAAYPTIDLQWFAEISLGDALFRVSNRSFYVQDAQGNNRYYDARCDQSPQINVDVGEWLQPNYQVSDLSLELNNRDGFFNDYLSMGKKFRSWTGAKVVVKIGFGEKYSNYFTIFEGQVADKQGLATTRDTIQLQIYDKLTGDNIPLPPRYFSSDNYPDIDTSFTSKPIPLVYGNWSENIPKWGAVNAIPINANEINPISYIFKVSDVALSSLDSAWLHRGDRTAEKPEGPIRIAANILSVDLDNGQFTIPTTGIVLDEPYFITTQGKAGAGSAAGLITSDTSFDFIQNGVKVGDQVFDGTITQATFTRENLQFNPSASGTAGNGFKISYYLMPVISLKDGAGKPIINKDPYGGVISTSKCYAFKVSANEIKVGVVQYYDKDGHVQIGTHTASAIKSAIQANDDTNVMVRVNIVGTLPTGYPEDASLGSVVQTVPAGPFVCVGGQDANITATITTVANFAIGLSSPLVFHEGDAYSIATVQYSFQSSDKFSVVCTGKPLRNVSTNRLYNVSKAIKTPSAFCVSFDGTYWLSDDTTQTVYNVTFKDQIVQSFSYAKIDPALTTISGLSITNDNKLWLVEPNLQKAYRFEIAALATGLSIDLTNITGLTDPLVGITGIAVQPDNQFWICDKFTSKFYLIQAFAATNPYLANSFSSLTSDVDTDEITDVAYDSVNAQVCYVDRATNKFYRVKATDGTLVSSVNIVDVNDNAQYIPGLSIAQDDTIFLLDAGNLVIYNYNDMVDADNNPALIARDLLQQFKSHTYNEFDLSWNQTAAQLSVFRGRLVVEKETKLVDQINNLLGQFNVVFHLKNQKFALFWITFANFRSNGRAAKEKDLVLDTFTPDKEFDQYFNSANANINYSPFSTKTALSDNYISPSGISFAGKQIARTLELSNVYRRKDVDSMMPLYVRLSTAEPEFITTTFGFRLIRSQIHDFINLNFADDGFDRSGKPTKSGRRFNNIPSMVRKLTYDLDAMTVQMKLWSLGGTNFPGFIAGGSTVGGASSPIVLSNIGRAGRVSPVATVTNFTSNSITVPMADGFNAQSRVDALNNKAWASGYKVDLIDGDSKAVLQTLTIDTVSGSQITFLEQFTSTPVITTFNPAGFIKAGSFIQYSTYDNMIPVQKALYASFGKPGANYPPNHTQELLEQRSGAHSFNDGGQPYVLYPRDFVSN